jgi:4'-phosphopantetheinyl transferase
VTPHNAQRIEKLTPNFSPAAAASTPILSVDLWLLDLSRLDNVATDHLTILSADELIRADTFKKNRQHFLATRILLRKALAHYTQLNAQDLVFLRTSQGKPFLMGDPVFFNLSHCDQFAVLAVSTQGAIGVDIESFAKHNFLKIAQRYFHPEELQALSSCEDSERSILFYKLWTLKEAFFKAMGGGISTGLNKASFSFNAENIQVKLAADVQLNQNDWQFRQYSITPSTLVSLALNAPQVIAHQWFDGNDLLLGE